MKGWYIIFCLPLALGQPDYTAHVDTSLPATSIGIYLKTLARRELGVDHVEESVDIGSIGSTIKDFDINVNAETLLSEVSTRLDVKIFQVYDFLSNITNRLSLGLKGKPEAELKLIPCCSNHPPIGKVCSVIHLGFNGTRTARLMANVFDNLTLSKGINRVFFMTTDRTTHMEFPASRACGQRAYTWHRDMFLRSLNPTAKKVMITLDRGSLLSTLQLDIGRAIAGFIINSLSVNDKVSLMTLDSELSMASNQDCQLWSKASEVTKEALHSHLNSINRMSYSNYDILWALRKSQLMMTTETEVPDQQVDYFIITTANSISSPEKFVKKCEEISKENPNVRVSIYLMDSQVSKISLNSSQEVSTTSFLLKALSASCEKGLKISVKIMDSTLLLSYNIGPLFEAKAVRKPQRWISVPWNDENTEKEDLLLTITSHLSNEAVIGIDIDYTFLFDDFIFKPHLTPNDKYYFAVLEKSSKSVVYHPSIQERASKTFPQGIALSELEEISKELEEKIYGIKIGFSSATSWQKPIAEENDIDAIFDAIPPLLKEYRWKHVHDHLIVILIKNIDHHDPLITPASPVRMSRPVPRLSQAKAIYHRLDLLSPWFQAKLCMHFDSPATLETGSVYLTPDAFLDPFTQLSSNVTEDEIQSYMHYLTAEDEDLKANPGLTQRSKRDLQYMLQALNTWKNMSMNSGMNNYIVRRFTASKGGVYFAYPGSYVSQQYDPVAQDWYLTAQAFPNRVILTGPRLDSDGAGYVLSVAKKIRHHELQFHSTSSNDPNIVMAMDLTIGYVNKMLLDTIPVCHNLLNKGVRCFLFDDEGYLIVHPSLFKPGSSEHFEGLHLSNVEHLTMTLMLSDPSLVQRYQCRQYSDMSIQYSYKFNTSANLQTIWENEDHECLKYQVSMLPETNVFLGIVIANENCSRQEEATFCPCSLRDRNCILCPPEDRYSSPTCECPCQCPLTQCQEALKEKRLLPLCSTKPRKSRENHPVATFHHHFDKPLPPCFDTDCARHAQEEKCFGIIGCSWCKYRQGQGAALLQILDQPFCSGQAQCFGGVLGGPTPYDQLKRGSRLTKGDKYFFRPTPSVLPIAGSILCAVFFLGVSAFCIRNFNKCTCARGGQNGRRPRHGSMLQVANFEEVMEDKDNPDEMHELGVTHKNAILSNSDEIIVSPYRVNPGYRRPPGTDSDHGYSTMTPIGDLDSEIIPYVDSTAARNRLQRLQHRQQHIPSSIQSVTSGVSSRASSPVQATKNQNEEGSSSFSSTAEVSSMSPPAAVARGASIPGPPGSSTSCKPVLLARKSEAAKTLLSESSEEATNSTQLLDPQTMLPRSNKNQFIVAATVHIDA